jgi:dUTP pyrophosphatase
MSAHGGALRIAIRRLAHGEGLPLPAYASEGAAGLDLVAALAEGQPLELQPGARSLVPTGLEMAIPPGFEGQVRPRSGLALRHGVTVLNAPGTIDADFRGEVQVLLVNLGEAPVAFRRGDRIAQLVICAVEKATFLPADALEKTTRGAGGFGSTGLSPLEIKRGEPS